MIHKTNTDNPIDFPSLDTIEESFINKEIARERLQEIDPNRADELLEMIWPMCKGNPWDAVPLYRILKISGKI